MSTWLDQCYGYCRQVKYLSPIPSHTQWQTKQPNTLWIQAQVLDKDRKTLPNLYVKAEYRLGMRTGRETYDFQIMWKNLPRGQHKRVLCIEVDANWKRTHAEPNGADIYGTHIQLGDKRAGGYCVKEWHVPPHLDHWPIWAKRFGKIAWLRHTSAVMLPPFPDDLFA